MRKFCGIHNIVEKNEGQTVGEYTDTTPQKQQKTPCFAEGFRISSNVLRLEVKDKADLRLDSALGPIPVAVRILGPCPIVYRGNEEIRNGLVSQLRVQN